MKKASIFFSFILTLIFLLSFSAFAEEAPAEPQKPVVYIPKRDLVTLLGKEYSVKADVVDLSEITSDDLSMAAEELKKFPSLQTVILSPKDEKGNQAVSSLSFDEFMILADAFPEAEFEYCFDLYGQPVSIGLTEELFYNRVQKIDDQAIEHFREVLPYLKNLKTLSFLRCPASDSAIDSLRTDFPDINIRWVVHFGAFSAWSDTEKIWAMAGMYHDEYTENLKYFHNLKYLDIGHNGITKCDFLYSMPDMEVLILAIGNLEDITPISTLKKLEYLEICDTQVKDLSPLAECTRLEHLNLGGIPATDLSPLYSLKNLKRLFADNMTGLTEEERNNYICEFMELLPDAEISFLMGPEGGVENGYWRFSRGPYTGSYVERYKLLREQFGYDHDYNQAYVYD